MVFDTSKLLPFKQVQSTVKIDIFNHKIRLHPTTILNIKESFKGQYTFQKPAWRDECQFLPFRNMYKKNKTPWLEACCSVKATLQTYSNTVNHLCSKETFKLHIQPLRGKNTSSKRRDGKRALCADAVPDGVSRAAGGSGRAQHPLLPGARGFASLGGICLPVEVNTGISSSPLSSIWLHLQVALGNGTFLLLSRLQRSAHTLLAPAFFFLPFFLRFNQILGTKTPCAGSDRAYN